MKQSHTLTSTQPSYLPEEKFDFLGYTQLLLSGVQTANPTVRSICMPPAGFVDGFATSTKSGARVQAILGNVSLFCVPFCPVTTPSRESSVGESESLFREPDAGNLPVRFDEREQEPEPGQTGLRGRGESRIAHPPGGYRHCAFLDSTPSSTH